MKNQPDKYKVGIIVPTMNRPDFVIRQLNYYSRLESPHTIYYTDSSNPENAQIIKTGIDKVGDKLNVVYQHRPAGDTIKSLIELLTAVKEEYVTFIGDDDYHVPDTLSICTEFLENHPEYRVAMGRSVTIRTRDNKVYGELTGIHDYARYSIEADNASERLLDYLGPHFTSIIAAVVPTKNLLRYFKNGEKIKSIDIKGEYLPCCLMIIDGKLKIVDHLGLIRQIHKSHFRLDDMFDQFTSPEWNADYQELRRNVVQGLITQDKITPQEAENNFKKAYWLNFQKYISIAYSDNFSPSSSKNRSKSRMLRTIIASRLPLLKKIYRKIRPILTDKPQLHYEVLQSGSKYHKDFQDIINSLNKPM